jgi:hypothetical protein
VAASDVEAIGEYAMCSRSERRSEPHLGAVELAQFRVAKENAMHVLIHLFKADFFVAEDFADENPEF